MITQEVELVEEALYRNAYIYPGWKYCLPGLLKDNIFMTGEENYSNI